MKRNGTTARLKKQKNGAVCMAPSIHIKYTYYE